MRDGVCICFVVVFICICESAWVSKVLVMATAQAICATVSHLGVHRGVSASSFGSRSRVCSRNVTASPSVATVGGHEIGGKSPGCGFDLV